MIEIRQAEKGKWGYIEWGDNGRLSSADEGLVNPRCFRQGFSVHILLKEF